MPARNSTFCTHAAMRSVLQVEKASGGTTLSRTRVFMLARKGQLMSLVCCHWIVSTVVDWRTLMLHVGQEG